MHRSDWGRRADRSVALAIHISRAGFDELLRQSVHARLPVGLYTSKRSWQLATRYGQVLFEWLPEHGPRGEVVGSDGLRLELRSAALRRFAEHHVQRIEDLRSSISAVGDRGEGTLVPRTDPYPLADQELARRLFWSVEEE